VGELSLREILLKEAGKDGRGLERAEEAPGRVAGVGDLGDLERHRKALEKVYEHPLIKEDERAEELLNRLL
jgi:hypothetical protein